MITIEAVIGAYQKFPDLLKAIYNNRQLAESLLEISDNHKLSDPQRKALANVVNEILLQTYELQKLVEYVAKDLKVSESEAKTIARELAGDVLLPMSWYIGKIEPLIQQLGGDVDNYLTQAKKKYPEVYDPSLFAKRTTTKELPAVQLQTSIEHQTLLRDFDHRLGSFRGRAEILLRLTGLSSQLEEAMSNNKITRADGEKLLQQLDVVSSAINTQDLNQLEIQALKRRLTNVLRRLTDVSL